MGVVEGTPVGIDHNLAVADHKPLVEEDILVGVVDSHNPEVVEQTNQKHRRAFAVPAGNSSFISFPKSIEAKYTMRKSGEPKHKRGFEEPSSVELQIQ